MSLELYDKALEKKLKNIFENTIFAPPDEAFARSNVEGKVRLPLISAYRISTEVNWEEFNQPASFRGKATGVRYAEGYDLDVDGEPRPMGVNRFDNPVTNHEKRKGLEGYRMTETVPVKLTYQVDIWAQLRKYADGIFSEVVFYLLHYPDLLVEIPSAEGGLVFSMNLVDTETSTDYEFGDTNVIHRYTLTYEVPYAQMFYEPGDARPVLEIPVTYLTYNQPFDTHPHEEVSVVRAEDVDPEAFE